MNAEANQDTRIKYQGYLPYTSIPAIVAIAMPLWLLVSFFNELDYSAFALILVMVLLIAFRQIWRYLAYREKIESLKSVSPRAYQFISERLMAGRKLPQIYVESTRSVSIVSGVFGDMVIPSSVVSSFEKDDADRAAQSQIIHEMGHLENRDNILLNIGRFENRLMFLSSVAFGLVFLVGSILFNPSTLMDLIPQLPDVVLVLLFYIGIPWVSIRLLLYSCELGADHFVILVQGTDKHIGRAIFREEIRKLSTAKTESTSKVSQSSDLGFTGGLATKSQNPAPEIDATSHKSSFSADFKIHVLSQVTKINILLEKIFPSHPSSKTRIRCLKDESNSLARSLVGFSLGLLAVVLAACTFPFKPITTPIVTAIIVFILGYFQASDYAVADILESASMLRKSITRSLSNILGYDGGVILGLILVSLFVFSHSRLFHASDVDVLKSTLLSTLGSLVLIALMVVINMVTTREVLTWYSMPKYGINPFLVFFITSVFSLYATFAIFFVLSSISWAVEASADIWARVIRFAILPPGIFVVMWPVFLFSHWSKKYKKRCANCGTFNHSYFSYKAKCENENCSQVFHKWLNQMPSHGRISSLTRDLGIWGFELFIKVVETYTKRKRVSDEDVFIYGSVYWLPILYILILCPLSICILTLYATLK